MDESRQVLYRSAQIAAMMGCTTQRVQQLMRREQNPLPHLRIGRAVYVRREDWESWLDELSAKKKQGE